MVINANNKDQLGARCGGACLESQLLRRLRKEDQNFAASLGNLGRPFLKQKINQKCWGHTSVVE